MAELITDKARAKAGYIKTTRIDKAGRTVPARDHVVVASGTMTADEMHKAMLDVAHQVGADESQIGIEVYAKGASPVDANPRHRTGAPKRVYGGFGPGTSGRSHA